MQPTRWFGIILAFTALTMLCTYLIPVDSVLIYLRYTLSIVFVFLAPGYCLVKILFRKKNKLDIVEESVLSVALSFGLAGLAGLFLGLSPIGLTVTSITVSLSVIVLALSTVAFLLKMRDQNREW
jgi:uncharacterized membrane protein